MTRTRAQAGATRRWLSVLAVAGSLLAGGAAVASAAAIGFETTGSTNTGIQSDAVETDAFTATCAAEARRTVVETRFDPGEVDIDVSRSAAELTAMKSFGGRWRTSGLTMTTQQAGIRTWTRVLHAADGRGCALPRFELTVTVQPQLVYVGREFARGSCSFDEIVAHEMRHVQANREHAARVTREFEGRLRAGFARASLVGDPATLNGRILILLEAEWMPRLKAELESIDARQAAVDSEAEFERLSRACGGEIPATLAPSAAR